ncbi:solute carrier family 23 member 2-like isoform X2 [Ornithodoros turicata]|uniref:solute carrier family 23 member 2-like isoform X2 n=1 Tax=Ornithodoros turicata TaxID=34597 RepID=UPI0031389346
MAADNYALELEEPEGINGSPFANGVAHKVSPNDKLPDGRSATTTTVGTASKSDSGVVYKVNDTPPWYLCLLLGFQHYLTMMGGTISYPFILSPKMCIAEDDPARGHIQSTIFFVSGLGTLLQATFGVRLPVIQGSTFAHLVPILAVLSLPRWQCPEDVFLESGGNGTSTEHLWQPRMREIQGAILVASLFEVFAGITGLIGLLMRWITPLGITPTIALIGLSLFAEASHHASRNWAVAFATVILVTIFSQYMRDVRIPIPGTRRKQKGQEPPRAKRFALFKLFPVILTIIIMWVACVILTVTDAVGPQSAVRTDIKLRALSESPWFRFPYPFQWGVPTVSTGAVVGLLAGVLVSMVESVGDYHACARLSGAPPPPVHAVNRGIFMEGIGSVFAALWGAGCGLTSYSENIGAIGITKVASRRVIQYGAAIMLVLGTLGKMGAFLVTIPEPIIGGTFIVMFSIVSAVGLSSLQFVDLNSSRNLFVLGSSLFLGLCVPKWVQAHPGVIATGSPELDQVINVLLSTSMFVGGFVGIFLDNTIPGTAEERGIHRWTEHAEEGASEGSQVCCTLAECYDPPGTSLLHKVPFFRYVPISPTFRDDRLFTNIRRWFTFKKSFAPKT